MNAIVEKGIDKTRLTSKGLGQTKPVADNNTEDGKIKKVILQKFHNLVEVLRKYFACSAN